MPRLSVTFEDARKVRDTVLYNIRPDGDPHARAANFCAALKAVTRCKIVAAVLEFDVSYTDAGEAQPSAHVGSGAVLRFRDQATNDVNTVHPSLRAELIDGQGNIIDDAGALYDWWNLFLAEGVGPYGAVIETYIDGAVEPLTEVADDLNGAAASIHPTASPVQCYAEDGADLEVIP